MPVPKRRKSKSRQGMHRAHHHLAEPNNFITCPNKACGQPMLPHRACPACGQYKGKQVIAAR